MRPLELSQRQQELVQQMIHMDQGVAYSPEFRITRSMLDYPSRKMQLLHAIHNGYLEPDDRTVHALFHSLASRQGERWQFFGEEPESYTDLLILGRQELLRRGLGETVVQEVVAKYKQRVERYNDSLDGWLTEWRKICTPNRSTETLLLLDDTIASRVESGLPGMRTILMNAQVQFSDVSIVLPGTELLFHGLLDETRNHWSSLVAKWNEEGIRRVVCATPTLTTIVKEYLPKIGISTPFLVEDILSFAPVLEVPVDSIVYAGGFYARYLMLSEKINAVVSPARRLNSLSVLEPVLVPLYDVVGIADSVINGILEDGLTRLRVNRANSIVVFDPDAYVRLQQCRVHPKIHFWMDFL